MDIKRILVVSREAKYCRTAVDYGVSLCKKYGSELYVIHIVDDSGGLEGYLEEEHKNNIRKTREELAATIAAENNNGLNVKELIREGYPAREISQVVKNENIDLIILQAHEEGHLEQLLSRGSNDEIIRKMPCSILMVKKEPGPVKVADLKI